MGVPGFFAWLIKNNSKLLNGKLLLEEIKYPIKWLMLDTNCLLHPCMANILERYKNGEIKINDNNKIREELEFHIWNKIEEYIDDIIEKVDAENIYIAIDGVAPIGKILQQRQRRYKYLFDNTIKLKEEEFNVKCKRSKSGIEEPDIPINSIELTPGTDYMERIHNKFKEYVKKLDKKGKKYIYSSYHDPGEGEHKLLQYIRRNLKNENIVIYGLDADLLFLSLAIEGSNNVLIMREKQVFKNENVNIDDEVIYNYVEIEKLHKMIKNLEISTEDFILICYLVGNDFMPGLLTTDIKKRGLDKIIQAYKNMLEKNNLSVLNDNNKIQSIIIDKDNNYKINHNLLKSLLKELIWTEKYIWKNINRDTILNQRELDAEELERIRYLKQDEKKKNLNKFIKGETNNTNFLDKIEFKCKEEYYNYYLGINSISFDDEIIKVMVNNYIKTIEWCVKYYFDDCISWSWGYNFLISPIILDIVKYYPNIVEIEKNECSLNPVEQLILAIPIDTYKFVIEEDIINKIKENKNIGYMIPESYNLDVNKEDIYWKCQVKIPMVEYNEYLSAIKKIKIKNNKNKIEKSLSNI